MTKLKSLRERASYNVDESFEKKIVEETKREAVKFLQKTRMILDLQENGTQAQTACLDWDFDFCICIQLVLCWFVYFPV